MNSLTQPAIRKKLSGLKKYQDVAERFVFPLILLIYPFAGLGRGLDLADITYALGNYRFYGSMDLMWKLATFIPNFIGRLITFLPFGTTITGSEFYATWAVCITALVSYYMLRRWFSARSVFLGEFLAESLFWCPPVILYNTLSSMFLACGLLILMHAVTDHRQHPWKYILAGAFFGADVMVRLPNVVYAVFIAALWLYGIIHSKPVAADRKPGTSVWTFADIWKKTGLCILGWIIGFGIPFIGICAAYGFGAYADMIGELFLVSRDAADYSGSGQLALIAGAYLHTLGSMLIMIPCVAAAGVIVMLRPGKAYWIKRVAVFAGFMLLFVYYYRSGVFTANYRYFDSMFEPAQMFIILGLLLLIPAVTPYMGGGGSERTWALISILVILITPTGSNNYTYPILNNLFIPAPVIIAVFARFRQRLGKKGLISGNRGHVYTGETALYMTPEVHFAWKGLYIVLVLVLLVQGTLFHMNYSFGDGYNGQRPDTRISEALDDAGRSGEGTDDGTAWASSALLQTAGNVRTGADKAHEIAKLAYAIDRETGGGAALLEFGSAPGLNYLYNMRPARDTVWPSLDSYRTEKFVEALGICREKGLPVVVMDREYLEMLEAAPEGEIEAGKAKYGLLKTFIEENGYRRIYDGGRFEAYVP